MNKSITKYCRLPLAVLMAASLAACGTDSGSSGGSSGSDGGVGEQGFTLRITDAPFDRAVRVDVWFDAVRFKPANGDWIEMPTSETIVGLASLQGTKSLELVSNVDLPPGDYTALRLVVDESRSQIELMGGGIYPLDIPTGANPGLLINEDFTVFENQHNELVVDIDLRGSIVEYGLSQFRLLPKVRVAHGNNYGHIRGKVDSSLLIAGSCSDSDWLTYNAVYVFEGHNARLDDIKPNGNTDLVTTAKILWDEERMSHVYEAGFLPAGDYTIALTCNADRDDPERNDRVSELRFFGVKNTVVKVNDLVFF